MTDEAKATPAFRFWDEYKAVEERLTGDPHIHDVGLELLCARVWREALAYGTTLADQQIVLTWKPQVDAAEAQRDRLAAALRKEQQYADEIIAWIGRGDKARARQQAYYARDVARAALADVPKREDT